MNVKTTLFISALMFVGTILISLLIFATEPEAEREAATRRGPMPVQVKIVEKNRYSPVIKAMGTVIPAEEITLRSRVSGDVLSISEQFKPGAVVKKGQPLLQIDDADYRLLLQQRQGELTQAQAALDIEMGEQALAEKEYKRIQRKLSEMQKALVLRKPQLVNAKGVLSSAEASYKQAELDLQRTTIKAPFNATILQRNTNTGSSVVVNSELVRLAGTEYYWVEASVPADRVAYLEFSQFESVDPKAPLSVMIRDRNSWLEGSSRKGRLLSKMGELTSQSRLVKVLIEVPDPLNLIEGASSPELLLGAFVECQIPARELQDVIRLEREYVRKNNTVWVMENQSLSIRQVQIDFLDEKYAYISDGLNNNDAVVITGLSRVREGAELRLQEDKNEQEAVDKNG